MSWCELADLAGKVKVKPRRLIRPLVRPSAFSSQFEALGIKIGRIPRVGVGVRVFPRETLNSRL
jgi:hypothetical protein